MNTIHLLSLAVSVWITSLFACISYTQIALLMYAICCCYWSFAATGAGITTTAAVWSGANPDDWGIKLVGSSEYSVFIICVVVLVALYVSIHEKHAHCATGALLASVGMCVAEDLFHMYVWLEVMTFITQGFASTDENLRHYWALQIVCALLILWSTAFIYRDSGTLTLPLAISKASVSYVMMWVIGWGLKLNLIANWMARGYGSMRSEHLFFFIPVFGKQAFLPLVKTAALLQYECVVCLSIVALMQMCLSLAMQQRCALDALVTNTVHMNAIAVLIVLHAPKYAALYLAHSMLAEALLVMSVLRQDPSVYSGICFLLAWVSVVNLPPSCMFFFKAKLICVAPYILWISAFASLGSLMILKSQFERVVANMQCIYTEQTRYQMMLAVVLVLFNVLFFVLST